MQPFKGKTLFLVPSRDENGHGTALAGIAAGSEALEEDFTGAAPEAMITAVDKEQRT